MDTRTSVMETADNWPTIELELDEESGLAVVAMNRPQVLNAWNPDLIHDLLDAIQTLTESWPRFRSVIVRGNGRAFSTGPASSY